jgi:CHAT domain-containing protein
MERFRAVLQAHSLSLEQLTGTDATAERVAALFAQADLLLLSCHGQGQPGYGRHGVLLAHDGQLPPVLMGKTPDSPGFDFLLSWDEISPPTPEVLVSAACSSGSASFGPGGERVSLDRSLLAAGTRLFFGPLWDVDLADAHTLAISLVERYLAGEESWAHAWHQVVSEAAGHMAPASWQSFILLGRWTHRLAHPREDALATAHGTNHRTER